MSGATTGPDAGALAMRLVMRLPLFVRSLQLYEPDHSALTRPRQAVTDMMNGVLRAGGPTTIRLQGGLLVVGEVAVKLPEAAAETVAQAARVFEEWGVAGFSIESPVTGQALDAAFRCMAGRSPGPGGLDRLNAELERARVCSLRFVGPLHALGDRAGVADPVLACHQVYLRGLRLVARMMARGLTPALVNELEHLSHALVELSEHAPDRLVAMASPRQPFDYRLRHPLHNALLSVVLARRLGLGVTALRSLVVCALLADVGMRSVSPSLRLQPGRLSDQDQQVLRQHPLASVKELLRIAHPDPAWRRYLVVAFEHHLGLDAAGYPSTRRWPDLHPFSRIIMVVDAFDALQCGTAWREARRGDEVLEVMRPLVGRRYDPYVFAQLEAQLRRLAAGADPEAVTDKLADE